MELSIEELAKLKDAVMGNIAITINAMHEDLSRYADGLEMNELYNSIKDLADNASLLQKISNTIELNKIGEDIENAEQ